MIGTRTESRWRRRSRFGALLVSTIVLAAACSSAASSAAPASAPAATTAPAASAPAASAPAASTAASACAPGDITLVNMIRSLSNPYHAIWDAGGQAYAKSIGAQYKVLANEGDSQKQVSQARTLLAAGNAACTVLNVDPNASADAEALVKAAQDAGAYIVTQWNKPDDLHPWDGYDKWIAHISFDGLPAGQSISEELFKAMGNKGKIVAIQGILDNVPAKQRFAGLEAALAANSSIEMLDQQTANWDRKTAFTLMQTWLTKYPDQIGGVWAANDDMALGALEALRSAGLAGKVPVVGVDATPDGLTAVAAGEMVATVASDAYWQGSAPFAMGVQALDGKIDVATLGQDKREFYGKTTLITKDNVAQFQAPADPANYAADWADPWARDQGQIKY
jgi:ribose transport system substrate-binding protein